MAWGFARFNVLHFVSMSLSPAPNDRIVVWFSCGAASAVAAKLTLLKYQDHDVRVVNNPVLEEDTDNRRFLADVEAWLDHPIEIATNPKYPDASADTVWRRTRFMSSPYGATCTRELKKKVRELWETTHTPNWHVLGFTADEQQRYARFTTFERPNVLPILIDAGFTKDKCAQYLLAQGLRLPRIYDLGYPNANCIGCVKATSATYWNLVRQQHPDVFAARASLSRELGVRLVRHKGKRIFLDELPVDARGRRLKTLSIECGIFCEETDAVD